MTAAADESTERPGDSVLAAAGRIQAGVADRLKKSRARLGLTHGDVAAALGLHRPAYTRVELGRQSMTAQQLVMAARMLGVSVEWLATGRDAKKPAGHG